MQKLFLIASSLFGALGVGLGAFGAHALKASLELNGRFDTYETAVKYQFYHALALLFLGLFMDRYSSPLFNYAGISFIGGTIIFSGSLYILCFTNVGKWGAVTPVGGLLFIIAWILLAMGISKAL